MLCPIEELGGDVSRRVGRRCVKGEEKGRVLGLRRPVIASEILLWVVCLASLFCLAVLNSNFA